LRNLIIAKVFGDIFDIELPLFLEHVALFEASSNLSLVFLVVSSDLTLPLLVDFYLEAALARPLLAKILIQFIH